MCVILLTVFLQQRQPEVGAVRLALLRVPITAASTGRGSLGARASRPPGLPELMRAGSPRSHGGTGDNGWRLTPSQPLREQVTPQESMGGATMNGTSPLHTPLCDLLGIEY